MNAEEQSVIEQGAIAHKNLEGILAAKYNLVANYLVLGLLFKENRDEGLFKLLGYDSFEDFIGSPDVGFSRSKAYGLIRIRELYKEKLGIDDKTLLEIGNAKLALIAPVVEKDREGWLDKAKHLSKSDLRLEIDGQGPGVNLSPFSPPPPVPAPLPNSCINGCKGDTEKSHFPITRGAGGQEVDDWWVPMCRGCHTEYHQSPKEWTWKYRKNWARWFYSHLSRGE